MPLNRAALVEAIANPSSVPSVATPRRAPSVSPSQQGAKRSHDSLSEGECDEDDPLAPADGLLGPEDSPHPTPSAAGTVTNLQIYTERECKKAKLDSSGTSEITAFNKLSLDKKLAKLAIWAVANEQRVAKLQEQKDHWDGPSESLKTNLKNYAHAVLVSPRLQAYRATTTRNYLLAIVKQERWDLPSGIEKDRAKWGLVIEEVNEALTQRRRAIKTQIKNSKNTDLWTLAEDIVRYNSDCVLSMELVARAAIMRVVYFEEEEISAKFWVRVDEEMEKIRKDANGNPIAASAGLKFYIDNDLKDYGEPSERREPGYEDIPTGWVQNVDSIVAGSGTNRG